MNKKPVIAIIDDDAPLRDAIDNLLRAAGFETQLFASGEAFLEGLSTGASVLVSDIRMYDLSGLDLKAVLNERGITLPVIFITAVLNDDIVAQATLAGAITCLGKPFNDEELIAAIRSALS
ncbi:response regulator [Tardiphaga sp. P9-11]|uniref:response regulator transcription factor n=1 Tax=Tardiphaga sp. P9-11 TaxID=2024614 RepID=UPI0011F377AA|nr:response regulator [Tardiphaga sp. P9-11]KAA0069996.1 response regulator [Tardiphaga sp. P9-11]